MNPAVHWKREIMFWLVTVPITFPKGWVAVEDTRVATKLLCNLFGYEYSTPHGKWDHPFWTVDERPLPAAGGGQFATSAKHMVEVAMVTPRGAAPLVEPPEFRDQQSRGSRPVGPTDDSQPLATM